MTISAAFNNALSGLTFAGRASGVVSDNISNALTPGYARRSLDVASNVIGGGGVRVIGQTRHSDPILTANRRSADAAQGHSEQLSGFYKAFETLVGTVNAPESISNKLAEFESSLIAASSNPGSAIRLDTAVKDAVDLSDALNQASEGVRQLRSQADREVGQQVDRLNTVLTDLESLNGRIQSVMISGGNTAPLLDQRQLLIDEVNVMIPVNVVARDHGTVALYSDGGAILLDGSAATLGFSTTGETKPHMTQENGLLSGLEINGIAVRTTGSRTPIQGGALAGAFEVRDVLSVDAQRDLDAVAGDLVSRFQETGLDPTTAATDPGLFTDEGARFDLVNEVGLAARLSVNDAVDPVQGGQSWRLRDGLGAAVPGPVGDARQLQAFETALKTARTQSSDRFGTGDLTAAGVSAGLLSRVAQDSALSGQQLTFAAATKTEMLRIEQEQGVDTDAELQSLMQIEQAYAANARVLQAVDEMMDALLGL